MTFPTITTEDLNGAVQTLPQDFAGDLNLIVVAYTQWQQREVDSWLIVLQQLEACVQGFHFYELPVVGQMGLLARKQLDFWMRAGIPDRETRGRTLTLYIDRAAFRAQLGIETEDTIALLLLNRAGEVIWQGRGPYHPEGARALLRVIHQASRP